VRQWCAWTWYRASCPDKNMKARSEECRDMLAYLSRPCRTHCHLILKNPKELCKLSLGLEMLEASRSTACCEWRQLLNSTLKCCLKVQIRRGGCPLGCCGSSTSRPWVPWLSALPLLTKLNFRTLGPWEPFCLFIWFGLGLISVVVTRVSLTTFCLTHPLTPARFCWPSEFSKLASANWSCCLNEKLWQSVYIDVTPILMVENTGRDL
jgi:hypothetical protein